MSDLVFALPAGSDQVSGGNIYNAQLIGALRALGPVQTLSIEACRARVERGEPGCYLIDSLNLSEFLAFPARQPGQSFTLLVHHLPSLEPDLGSADANQALGIEQAALARFDAFVATSPFTTALLVSRGHAAARILTLPPIFDAPSSQAARARRAFAPPLRALLVGNLIPRKSIFELFVALDARLTPDDDLIIDVVGRADVDPSYARRCANFTSRSARLAPIVRYDGAVPHAEMPSRYKRAHLFVSASRMETFGMALQEAAAHGLPILALDGGYVRHHFTDGENGLLVTSLDALAHELLSLTRDQLRMRRLFDSAHARRPAGRAGGWPDTARQLFERLA